MELVSVIIPTYNRFKYLLNTIKSIRNQTYKNIEIIIVNDNSTQKEYYNHNLNNINIIHMQDCSKKIYGDNNIGYLRNIGISVAKGKYIAFCNDDTIWFPNKLELQIKEMIETNCKISFTDGLVGDDIYNSDNIYAKNSEKYNNIEEDIPKIWNLQFLGLCKFIVHSSIIVETEILNKINNLKNIKNGDNNNDCWLSALKYTDILYVKDICFYIDIKDNQLDNIG
jgi:glycosyltransferase involved in cell wall biosynthesis